jgi:Protein of unknown function (DUF1353)
MSRFLTTMRLEEIEDISNNGKGTWRLLTDLVYESDLLGRIVIVPAGMVTDLDSVPRLPLAYLLTNGYARKAALPHDLFYTNHEVSREVADKVLYEAAIVCGVPAWRAWLIYIAVRIGGGGSWDSPGPDQPDYVSEQINR